MDKNITIPEAIGQSEAFIEFQEQISKVASIERPVLIIGERGTGKELAALKIHFLSKRWQKSLITLNCSALTPTLIGSELFGYEKGAFTGALSRQPVKFPSCMTIGIIEKAVRLPRKNPIIPPIIPSNSASRRIICITCPRLKPIALNIPISLVRSFTEPIIVTSTRRDPIKITSIDTPRLKDLNSSMDCILDMTACFIAVTFALGNFHKI